VYGDARVFRASPSRIGNVGLGLAFEGTPAPPSARTDVVTTQKTTNKMFSPPDWLTTDKFVLNAFYLVKTGGVISHNARTRAARPLTDAPFTDNTTKQSLVFKGKYEIDKKFGVGVTRTSAIKHKDDQMNGYFGAYPYYMVVSASGVDHERRLDEPQPRNVCG
jgi:hypothetical protein